MPTAGLIISIQPKESGIRFPRPSCVGICLALPSAGRSSRTNCFSSSTIKASVLIFRAHPAQTMSLQLRSGRGTLALFARQVLQAVSVTRRPTETNSYITLAYPLQLLVLLLPRQPPFASHSPITRFRRSEEH